MIFSFDVDLIFTHICLVWIVIHLALGFKLHSVFRFAVTFPPHLLYMGDFWNYLAANKELKFYKGSVNIISFETMN